MKSQSSDHDSKIYDKQERINSHGGKVSLEDMINAKIKRSHSHYHKHSINLKAVSSIIKDYKLEGPENGAIFYGYSKRNSQPVVIKYAP